MSCDKEKPTYCAVCDEDHAGHPMARCMALSEGCWPGIFGSHPSVCGLCGRILDKKAHTAYVSAETERRIKKHDEAASPYHPQDWDA